jgi:peptide alpha-N-acetyltransferase
MVRWEDTLRAHPFFARVAIAAIDVYLTLYDQPHLAHASLSNGALHGETDADFAKLSDADKKKAIKKAKRDQQKQADAARRREEVEKDRNKKTGTATSDGNAEKKPTKGVDDDDPQGAKLAQTDDPLKEAMRFLTPLLEFSPKLLKTQLLAFEVFFRRSTTPLPSRRSLPVGNRPVNAILTSLY